VSLLVFLGPSLDAPTARRLAPGARFLPPAGRGDVFRALRQIRQKPRAIALIDGVFEARPAVWHRELLAALEEGIAVFGAASMGALRAAELWPFGMVGIGQVYRWVRDGTIVDDAEVAILHADREHGYRSLTVPLVNVRGAAAAAHEARVISRSQVRALISAASVLFYQERDWPRVLATLRWKPSVRAAFQTFLTTARPDVKADDARACLSAAAELVRQHGPALPAARPSWPPASALVRARLGDRPLKADAAILAALARSFGAQLSAADLAAWPGSTREREQAALVAWARRNGHVLLPGIDSS
jgi:hypothetical protein